MINERIKEIAQKYRERRIIKPSELLLEPGDALELLSELVNLDILLHGYDCWHYIDKKEGLIVEEPGGGFDVGKYIPYENMTPGPSIELIKQFIKDQHPPICELISFTFDDPEIWDLFTGEESS